MVVLGIAVVIATAPPIHYRRWAAAQTREIEALRRAIVRDPLTGLLNRRGFQERMEVELDRAARDRTPLALGGDEFAFILPNTAEFHARSFAERLRAATEQSFGDTAAALTLSLGIACFPGDGTSTETLLKAADQAIYAAKSQGKNRIVREPGPHELAAAC